MTVGHDPCDEMVSLKSVIHFVATHPPRGITTGNPVYDRIGAIVGLPREEAKRRVYRELYSG